MILATTASGFGGTGFYIIIMIFLVGMMVWTFYQNSQTQRRRQKMQSEIQRGDEVVTVGGIVGRVVAVTDDRVVLEVADGVQIQVMRAGIGRRAST
jgi:preprotein translocase subunit YajC